MIKVYSEPKNKELYGDYSFLVDVILFGLSILGSFVSAYTEWYGFKSWNNTDFAPNAFPIAMIVLVESSRFVIPLLVLTAFRLYFKKEYKLRIPALLVLFGISVGLTFLSVEGSKDGIKYKVNDRYEFKDTVNVDSTKYKILVEKCENNYSDEKDRIESDVNAEYEKDLKKEKRKARNARQRISELKDKTAKWAVATVSTKTNVLEVAMGTAGEIEKEMDKEISNKKKLAKANYEACKADAKDTLLYYINLAESKTNELIIENDESIDRNINVSNWAMYLGILLIWVYSIAKGWLYYVSGREIIYTFGDEDKDLNFFQRFWRIFKQYILLGGDKFLEWFGATLENTKQQQVAQQQKLKQQQILKQQQAQQAAAAQQQALLQQQQQLELEKQRMATEKAKAEAEAAKAKAEAEKARIEAETAKELELTKIRLAKERLERQALREQQEAERQRKEQQEVERLQQQKEEVEQQQALLQQQQQEIQQQKALLEKAKQVEQQKQQQSQQQVDVKQQLNTTMEKITTTNTTTKAIDYQSIVNDLIKRETKNNVLVLSSDFTTPIRQWHSRWKATEKKINNGQISEGRMKKALQGMNDNKSKYETMVQTLANQGIKVYFNEKKNRVEFEKM